MTRILLVAMLGLVLSVPQGLMLGDAYSKGDIGGASKGSDKGKADKGGSKEGADGGKGVAGQKAGGQSQSKSSSANKSASSAGNSGDPKGKSKKGEPSRGGASGTHPAKVGGKPASGALGLGSPNPGKLAAPVGATKAIASRTDRQREPSVRLPGRLRPERGSARDTSRPQIQLAVQGVFGMLASPTRSPVAACRGAVFSLALPLGAERVQVSSAGLVRRRGERLSVPVDVSIRYPGEMRRARVDCRLNSAGVVTALH